MFFFSFRVGLWCVVICYCCSIFSWIGMIRCGRPSRRRYGLFVLWKLWFWHRLVMRLDGWLRCRRLRIFHCKFLNPNLGSFTFGCCCDICWRFNDSLQRKIAYVGMFYQKQFNILKLFITCVTDIKFEFPFFI